MVSKHSWTVLHSIKPAEVLSALVSVRKSLSELVKAGLVFRLTDMNSRQLLVPRNVANDTYDAMLNACEEMGGQVSDDERRPDFAKLNAFGEDVIAVFAEAVSTAPNQPVTNQSPRTSIARPVEGTFVYLRAKDEDELAKGVHAVTTSASGSRIGLALQSGVALFHLADAGARIPTDALINSAAPDAKLMNGYPTGKTTILLDKDLQPPKELLNDLRDILRSIDNAGFRADRIPSYAIVLLPDIERRQTTVELYFNALQTSGIVNKPDAVSAAEVTSLTATPDDLKRLRQRLNTLPRAGHMLKIGPVPNWLRPELQRDDRRRHLEEQKSAINDELERLYNQVNRPNLRLYRFTAHQLEAMAALLRRFPMPVIDRGEIKYARQATERSPLGVHYLLCNEETAQAEHPFAELFWRGETDDSPISFWVDPGWWRQFTLKAPKSLLFVPDGCSLSPTLYSFSDNDMDEYLEHQVNNWLSGEQQAAAAQSFQQPLYVFLPADGGDSARVRVEVLERDAFRPLKERLPWINDLIEYSASIDINDYVREGASQAYRARVLSELTQHNQHHATTMKTSIASAEKEISNRLVAFLERYTTEVEYLSERGGQLVAEIDALVSKIQALDRIVEKAGSHAKAVEKRVEDLPGELNELEELLSELQGRFDKANQEGETLRNVAQKKIKEQRDAINKLRRSITETLHV